MFPLFNLYKETCTPFWVLLVGLRPRKAASSVGLILYGYHKVLSRDQNGLKGEDNNMFPLAFGQLALSKSPPLHGLGCFCRLPSLHSRLPSFVLHLLLVRQPLTKGGGAGGCLTKTTTRRGRDPHNTTQHTKGTDSIQRARQKGEHVKREWRYSSSIQVKMQKAIGATAAACLRGQKHHRDTQGTREREGGKRR